MPKETIEPITLRQIQDAINTLSEISEKLKQALQEVKTTGHPLYVFRCNSLRRALERLLAFRVALSQSLMALHSGRPFGPDTEKNPRAGR